MERTMIFIGSLVGLLLLVIVTMPYWLDLNRYRDQYIPMIEQALNRKVEISHIRAMWFPHLGFRIEDAKIFDDPSMAQASFVEVSSIEVAIKWKPLFDRRVEIQSLALHRPLMTLLRTKDNTFNADTLGREQQKTSDASTPDETSDSIFAMFGVEQLTITNGTLRYEDRSHGQTQFYLLENVDMKTESVRMGDIAKLTAHGTLTPSQRPVSLEGTVGPLQRNMNIPQIDAHVSLGQSRLIVKGQAIDGILDLDLTSSRISLEDLPLSVLEHKPVLLTKLFTHVQIPLTETDPLNSTPQEIRLHPLEFELEMGESILRVSGESVGTKLTLHGTAPVIHSQNIPVSLPFHRPVSVRMLNFQAKINGPLIHVEQLAGQIFDGQLQAAGHWDMRSEVPAFHSTGTIHNVNIKKIQKILQPSAFALHGTGAMNWEVKGTVPNNHIPFLFGHAQFLVENGQFQGFDLLQQIEQALKLKGLLSKEQGVTRFSILKADVEFQQEQFPITSVLLQGVEENFLMQGSGLVMRDQSLNVNGDLQLGNVISEKIIQQMPIAKMAAQQGKLVVPFTVKGHLSKPTVGLDFRSIQRRLQKQVGSTVKKILEGDPKDVEELLKKGKGILKQLFGK
ncbi:MAG: hypothetical protein NPIRA01_05690 [Nitrospirales bacterium]|nr:MAG: hypothetical protein NPIRA01_05690 [Nitrospirales bacterium]